MSTLLEDLEDLVDQFGRSKCSEKDVIEILGNIVSYYQKDEIVDEDEEVNGNIQITSDELIQRMDDMLDALVSLNGKPGSSKYGWLNGKGRRQVKRVQKFLHLLEGERV
tara:strand:+ start:69 stop:395 length:327 start_codon:yes stop_codon:yes gene_type:complete